MNDNFAAEVEEESQQAEQTIMSNYRDHFGSYGTQHTTPIVPVPPLPVRVPAISNGGNRNDYHNHDYQYPHSSCFPQRLFRMLNIIDQQQQQQRQEFSSIVSWHASGVGFVIHKPDNFMKKVVPVFFQSQTRLRSFQRQLNNYGFQRIKTERQSCASLTYYHGQFLRDSPGLCKYIRLKSKLKPLQKEAMDSPTKVNDVGRRLSDESWIVADSTNTTAEHSDTTPDDNKDGIDSDPVCEQWWLKDRSTGSFSFGTSSRGLLLQDMFTLRDRLRSEQDTLMRRQQQQYSTVLAPANPPEEIQGSSTNSMRWSDRNEFSEVSRTAATLNVSGAFSVMSQRQHPAPDESYLFTFVRFFEDLNETREITIRAEHPHESMMRVVTRLQCYPDTELFCFSKSDRRAIHQGSKKIVFKLPQVPGGAGVPFSKFQFGQMTALQVLELTPERPMRVELLTSATIEGKNIDIF